MKRMRMLVLALISLILSGLVALLAHRVLRNRLTSDMSRVVVATQRLQLGSRLSPEKLRVVPWPRGSVPEGSFADAGPLTDRGVVVPIAPNEPVLESKLAPKEAGAGLTTAIPDGMRAVAVKVDPVIGVGGFVLPGTRVDVIVTGSLREGGGKDTSKVILESARVLSAGTSLEDNDGKPRDVPVVTLLVSPEDAQKLALASVDGKIQLALRNPLDLRQVNPAAVKKEELYKGSTSAAAPEAAAPGEKAPWRPRRAVPAPVQTLYTVELIQGDKRDSLTFEATRP